MTRLTWGELDKRSFEYGVDRGVFYIKNGAGFAWQGLVSVQDMTADASQTLIYIDGFGHENQLLMGNFAATIQAMTYPDEFEPYDGYDGINSAQGRRAFDFSFRTMQDGGHYKIHLVYNALATPSEKNRSTINERIEVSLFAWDLSTRPELIPNARASSHFVIDTKYVNDGVLSAIETRLYGTDESAPDMPTVIELLDIFEEFALFKVTNHGDGTATIEGPDSAVYEVNPSLWMIDWPSVEQVAEHTYRATSR